MLPSYTGYMRAFCIAMDFYWSPLIFIGRHGFLLIVMAASSVDDGIMVGGGSLFVRMHLDSFFDHIYITSIYIF